MSLFAAETFSFIVLPVLIFIARIFDVTLGTIRIIFVSRGNKLLAPVLGFFEVIVWITAISQIMRNANNIYCYIAYAGGFAMGTWIGLLIEEKLALGILIVRIILIRDECRLAERLASAGYGVTTVDANGVHGQVKLVYTIVKRKNIENVTRIIQECQSDAFYTVEDAKTAANGVFPVLPGSVAASGRIRKGK